jgi:hypothetical protein
MRYEIRVEGALSELLLEAFPQFEHEVQGRETLLVGRLSDQAALYGTLNRIEALGLALIEVRRESDANVRSGSPRKGEAR